MAGGPLPDTGNERESTTITLKKSITNLRAGWLLKPASFDGDLTRTAVSEPG